MRNKRLCTFLAMCFCAAAIIALASPQDCGAWGRGTFYLIGTGPAGPQTATLQALNTIKKMDFILAYPPHAKLFQEYIGDIPVLFDPWKGRWDYKGKSFSELNEKERAAFKVESLKVRQRNVATIKELLKQGKNVGLLDSGNPCLFGPGHWYVDLFDQNDVVVIPGMGCDAAAMAALKKSVIPAYGTRFVLQSMPFFLTGKVDSPDLNFPTDKQFEKQILKDLTKYEHTMVLYMALNDPVNWFKALGEFLPKDMPTACVYWAGYPLKQRIVRGTVADMGPKLAKNKEKVYGLLFIGRFLEGQPYESHCAERRK